jgi:hypothetical protein
MIGLLLRSWRVLGGLAVVAFAWPMFPAGARTVVADGWHSTRNAIAGHAAALAPPPPSFRSSTATRCVSGSPTAPPHGRGS